jgi:hypothetical protein
MMGYRIALNFEDRVTRRMRSEDYATMQRRSGMADVLAERPEEVITARADPSANRVRLTPPICTMGGDTHFTQFDVLATLGNGRCPYVAHDDLAAQFSLSARSTRSFVGGRFATDPPLEETDLPPMIKRKKRGNNPAGHCRGAVPPGQA